MRCTWQMVTGNDYRWILSLCAGKARTALRGWMTSNRISINADEEERISAGFKEALTARFRNVAERHGKVDLEFQIVVPQALMDSRWQLRLYPDMFVLGDSVRLDGIVVTGKLRRQAGIFIREEIYGRSHSAC